MREEWTNAGLRALGVLVVSYLLFLLIPNWLVGYLALRVTTTARDVILIAWFAAAFVIGCVAFVVLQPRSDG